MVAYLEEGEISSGYSTSHIPEHYEMLTIAVGDTLLDIFGKIDSALCSLFDFLK